jgi:hypothetical protein
MTRKISVAAMLIAAPALSGCVVQAGLAAAELARYLPEAERPSNAHLRPAATEACTRRAGQYGSVHIVDVQQQRADRLVVWGSVTDAQQRRRTFECHFTTALVRFKLREIGARS